MKFTTLLFDLDDTLYPAASGLWAEIRKRMDRYMHVYMGLPEKDIPRLRQVYLETYGTTLRGLQANFQVDTDEFLSYVHDIPLARYLTTDSALRHLLLSLPQEAWIFTNADAPHARRVVETLGLDSCFAGIIDVRAVGFHSKPDPRAYAKALEIAGVSNPDQCIFFDDSERNLAPARRLGLFTVQVGADGHSQHADLCLDSLHDLPDRLPALWTQQN